MRKWLQKTFALTRQGAESVVRAIAWSFGVYAGQMLPPMFLMLYLDDILLGHPRAHGWYFLLAVVILAVLYVLIDREYDAMYNATYRESAALRIDIAETLAELPLSYFSKHDLSDLSQTIMADVSAIEHAMSHAMPKAGGFAFFFPIIGILLLIGNVKLGLAVVLPTALYVALILLSKNMQDRLNKHYYDKLRDNSNAFQEAIELQQEIKSFGLSEDVRKDLYRNMEEAEKIHRHTEFSIAVPMLVGGVMMDLSIAIVLLVGVALISKGEISILYLIGYLIAAMKLREAAAVNGELISELFYIHAPCARIQEMRGHERQRGEDRTLDRYDIVVEDVHFAYEPGTPVLEGISFVAKQDEVTALIGKSGCGKTSVLRLISRLYDYDRGRITIGGVDIHDMSTRSLFRYISIVFQEVTLFNASVMENIRIGRQEATDEEVMAAARLANCEEFIEKLPEGYDTFIGENGANLSGGERQRLSIARAFLKDAPIILLDEIAAALDVDNEKKIQDSLNQLIENKTVLIISHRLKSIENADKIVAIDDGRIECMGAHDDLMRDSALYADLVKKSQMAESFVY